MNNSHVKDSDIQRYVLDELVCDDPVDLHIRSCPLCLRRAESYRILFSALDSQANPSLGFDLSEALVRQIEKETKKYPLAHLVVYFLSCLAFAGVITEGYIRFRSNILFIYKHYVLEIVSGVSGTLSMLLLVAIVTFLVFQSLTMYRKYRQKINDLNFY